MKKLIALSGVAAALLLAGCGQENKAEDKSVYPAKPIEMIIPFGEGGASDTFARKFSTLMASDMPQPIQAVNKKGSSGLVGMVYAAQQPSDGYTILEVTPSMVIADALGVSKAVKFMRDFEPLARIQSDVYVLCLPENSKFASFEELVKFGQTNPVTFGGVSPGGLDDLTLNALADETGVQVKFIPYRSGSEVKAAVLGGEVDIYLDKIVSAVNYIKDGKVKPVLVLNDQRIDQIDVFKEVPTAVELGYDVTIGSWRGFVVKKGTAPEVKQYLIDKMKSAYETKEYKDFAELNLVNIRPGYLDAEGFYKQWESEYKKFDKVAVKVGLK
ncbi:tripartite tricarboxylate transporter substrate binding protein [Vibrio sp. A1-b2]|uniref:Bug family tripartite tricarboxylate transporter substrate binding protein n=1 Tax=Vibrio sp. A1-b2 TaxID=2912248 RepID=UPI001F191B93|nr:tripartite tricarboxylate transporter substrate binding protein [Vibrio sp. A1-b2]MCF7362058.1 tripartite tricarboxylate transporter substrate binding protein [Vibrio sp. A1-b2]